MVKRIYVEKKKGFNVESESLFEDIKDSLGIKNIQGVRVINRYDIENVDEETYELAKFSVFAEAAVDNIYEEELEVVPENMFAVEYLPGQYDQRADSAVQCIRLMKPEVQGTVKFAKVIAIEGNITKEEMQKIKEYLVNPVDSQIASLEKPKSLAMEVIQPEDVKTIEGFTEMTEKNMKNLIGNMGFAMSIEDIKHIQEYFKREEDRNPTVTELKVIDTYWSDHCRHTTFNTELTDIYFEENEYGELIRDVFAEYIEMRKSVYGDRKKDICLMDMACIAAKYLKKEGKADDVDESEEVNACSIKVKAKIDGKEEDWLVMFKNETHNHPTEIEPFGGAATCLGGAIRDPLSGRVYVYQAMRVTGAGDPRRPIDETLAGKLPQKKITREAAAGYSSYGNQIGLATGLVEEVYDEGYVAKRMEVGAVIGAAPASHVVRKVPEKGDVVILVGGRTGRDGCGGATGSSKAHSEESILECGAEVQKGNPPVERNIQRLFRRKEAATLIKRCNDFGAGGVSVAIGELADSLEINLDEIPKKYEGLDGTELAISESQERMAVVVRKEDEEKFKKYATDENLEATTVAKVTETGRLTMFFKGKTILDLSRAFLDTNGAKQRAMVKVESLGKIEDVLEQDNIEDCLEDLNCCSKKGLIERFDSTIGAGTVLMPLGGKYQLSPAAGMAAKLPVIKGETTTATLMTYGFDPKLAKKSPFHGAMYAVIDSVTKIVAMGGDFRKVRLTFQEYFEKMSSHEAWGKPMSALLGALKVQKELEIPAIGGKDSMSGTFNGINVPPSLISFAVNAVDTEQIVSTEFKKTSSQIVLLKTKMDQNYVIDFEKYKKTMDKVYEIASQGKILAANTVGKGGVFMSIVYMCLGNKIGANIKNITKKELMEARYGSLVLEINKKEDLGKLLEGIEFKVIGETTEQASLKILEDHIEKKISLNEIIKKWEKPLEKIFPTKTTDAETAVEAISYKKRNSQKSKVKVAKPKVIIPVFPGTNCEVDSARAFQKAGAETDIHIINNLTQESLIQSIDELAEKIKKAQIIMLPGGFSGGDEPEGSAKFITAVFRNPKVKNAVNDLLENRDGLVLGICNGFQALIKLGLVPYGKIVDGEENSPTLTYNNIGRHMSSLIRTRVSSVKSPWLANCQEGEIHTIPISHGEGKFVCNENILKDLIENGQIATQYVDFNGKPSMNIKHNPNYSVMAVEGITSKDGRVFGKMGHSERVGENLYKNVIGNKDQQIFEAGVNFFKED